jgi:hypothetical protein
VNNLIGQTFNFARKELKERVKTAEKEFKQALENYKK